MENNSQEIWDKCLKFFKENMPASSFKTWFARIVPVSLNGNVLKIQVPSSFFKEYIEEHFASLIANALYKYIENPVLIYDVVVDQNALKNSAPNFKTAGIQAHNAMPQQNVYQQGIYSVPGRPVHIFKNQQFDSASQQQGAEPEIQNPFVIPGIKKVKVDPQLNPNYTIDNFVEGACNRLGRRAAEDIAKKPGKTIFNPLMIFGNSGLGKTHLAQAIGNSVRELYPEKTVLYVEANKFQTQYADACRNNTRNDFIHFYQMIDLLIIDDVQEFAGKTGTQETFFAIFNSLHLSGKQIIMTCDTMPSELKGLTDRLLSRFRWGLTVEVQAPDYETRLNILKKKVYNDGMNISEDILDYIAKTVISNVRELEGVLISLLARSTLTRNDLTLEDTKNFLGKIVRETEKEYSVDFIVKTVCAFFGIKESVLNSKSRAKDIASARQLSMYFSKKFTDLPYKTIGTQIGGRDHSTVLHACKAVTKSIETDEKFAQTVAELEAKIKTGQIN